MTLVQISLQHGLESVNDAQKAKLETSQSLGDSGGKRSTGFKCRGGECFPPEWRTLRAPNPLNYTATADSTSLRRTEGRAWEGFETGTYQCEALPEFSSAGFRKTLPLPSERIGASLRPAELTTMLQSQPEQAQGAWSLWHRPQQGRVSGDDRGSLAVPAPPTEAESQGKLCRASSGVVTSGCQGDWFARVPPLRCNPMASDVCYLFFRIKRQIAKESSPDTYAK
ncbi:uncharacterized protein LOC144577208 [Callithrix jacchus]